MKSLLVSCYRLLLKVPVVGSVLRTLLGVYRVAKLAPRLIELEEKVRQLHSWHDQLDLEFHQRIGKIEQAALVFLNMANSYSSAMRQFKRDLDQLQVQQHGANDGSSITGIMNVQSQAVASEAAATVELSTSSRD